jgi:hypothetical protein
MRGGTGQIGAVTARRVGIDSGAGRHIGRVPNK